MTNPILAEITAYTGTVSPSDYRVSVHDQMACANETAATHASTMGRGIVYLVELPDNETVFVASCERGAWFVVQWAADRTEHAGWFEESRRFSRTDQQGKPWPRVTNWGQIVTVDGRVVPWQQGPAIKAGCPIPPAAIDATNAAPVSLQARTGSDAAKRLTVSA